jgi:Tol biopolymer transport system component
VIGRTRPLVVLVALGACLVVPAPSQATLVFTRNSLNPAVYAANDNGSATRKVGSGSNPRVSPDGQTIVFYGSGKGNQPADLMMAAAAGGPARKLASGWQDPFVFAWSSDSSTIAVVLGPEIGKQRLTTVDLARGEQHTIDRGYFSGVSFAPGGSEQLVYAKATSEGFPPRSDVYRIDILPPGAESVSAEEPRQLTTDHRSFSPLWGPSNRIVFVKQLGEKQRKYGPKKDLFLMQPDGTEVRRLTHTKVGPLQYGLTPIEWSANGKRLLTAFSGQDTYYAVAVNPTTGSERALTKEREVAFVGAALSKDGTTVLGSLGGLLPGPGHKVVSIPYAGGKPKVLAKNASEPDWSR